ncbi:nitroreductase [Phenylobacterium sp.]|uniref:nitroreductase family protein n=1 Tax=Phenylobacterium sp. TaxID=1871053 RepID=UPI0025D85DC4|nr:nitroreductase [Phenylobacterium sp.]MCA6287044.1 nitroreductase [Phenylobacterium sp.]MCA6287977.1 nitroreductase [Phenylobacterium sp.]MCA6310664.1 nitroreductase [Phenylobacterium sp.]MCA6324460.1 nitroreductase [Phenylobacterium sp.]MCA6336414.1 nitroreductase [Phenylobacterium sp.]
MTRRSRTALPPAPAFGEPVLQPEAPQVLDFLARRRSSSALTLGGPGPSSAEIETLIRLASRVPDHGKLSPWRFVVLAGEHKAAFADRLETLARSRGDNRAVAKLGKLRTPPACIAVISRPREADIREWEQVLSAGAVCTTLLYAASAMGFGANWITDWYAYDAEACAVLGLSEAEKVAGFILIGEAGEPPRERERPLPEALVSTWTA